MIIVFIFCVFLDIGTMITTEFSQFDFILFYRRTCSSMLVDVNECRVIAVSTVSDVMRLPIGCHENIHIP